MKDFLAFYQTASFDDVKKYYKKFGVFKFLAYTEQQYRDELCKDILPRRVQIYRQVIQHLEAGAIDKAFLCLKIEITLKSEIEFKLIPHKAKQAVEGYFYKIIYDLIKPFISNDINIILNRYIDLKPGRGIGKLYGNVNQEQVEDFRSAMSKQFSAAFPQENSQSECILGNTKFNTFTQVEIPRYMGLMNQASQLLQTHNRRANANPGNLTDNNDHIAYIMELKDAYLQVRAIMKPVRDRMKQLKEEIRQHKAFNNISKDTIEPLRPRIAEMNAAFQAISKQTSDKLASLLQEQKQYKTCNALLQEITALQQNIIVHQNNIDVNMRNLGEVIYLDSSQENRRTTEFYLDSILKNAEACHRIIEDFQKKVELLRSAIAHPVSEEPEVPTTTVVSDDKPKKKKKKKKAKPSAQSNKVLSREEWNVQNQANREKRLIEKDKARRALGEATILEINEANLARAVRRLSDEDLKAREERVSNFLSKLERTKSTSIKEAFQAIYADEFGNKELRALVKMLKDNGESIDIIEIGSSHYTIKIRGKVEYVDKDDCSIETDFDESGKGFSQHPQNTKSLPNHAKFFPRHTMDSIQRLFYRAGYTHNVLDITPAARFDAAKCR